MVPIKDKAAWVTGVISFLIFLIFIFNIKFVLFGFGIILAWFTAVTLWLVLYVLVKSRHDLRKLYAQKEEEKRMK